MRIVVLLLVIANLTLFAYTRLDSASRGESSRLKQQVQPDKIKLLTPPQVAALGPAKMAALADVCIEWGPFSDVERVKAINDLEPLQLGRLLSQRRVDVSRQSGGPPRVESQTILIVRDPQQGVVSRFKELQTQYSGSDLRIGACPTAS
ncbi:MAG TPA: hypothetical protein VGL25_16325 [Casimicrobiaceae bacterium]|jgi:hypothetical protein